MKQAFWKTLAALLALCMLLTLTPAAMMEGEMTPPAASGAIDEMVEETDFELGAELTSNGNLDDTGTDDAPVEMDPPVAADGAIPKDGTLIPIDAEHFPDDTFRAFIAENFGGGDGFLSEAEISAVEYIDCSDKGIASLKGVEYFTALTKLHCDHNNLTALDVSGLTSLKELMISGNPIASLNISGCTSLKGLDLTDGYVKNELVELNASNCTALKLLQCDDNKLTKLNISGCSALATVTCRKNKLTELDLSNCPALVVLSCESNLLSALDVSACPALAELYCTDNRNLTALDLSGCSSLIYLGCQQCGIQTLNAAGCSALTEMYFSENPLTALDITGCSALEVLYCGQCLLTKLDVSGCKSLDYLSCSGNKLTTLNASGCSALNSLYCQDNQLTSLSLSGCTALTELDCSKNQLPALDVTDCTKLIYLYCWGNQLTTLKIGTAAKLRMLDCSNNKLTKLDIQNCPILVNVYWEGEYSVSDNVCTYSGPHSEELCLDIGVNIIAGDPPKPAGLYISAPKSGPIDVKEKMTLEALTNDPSISLKKLKWASSDKKVATVTGKGVVTGKADGTAVITVTTGDGRSATIDIQVKDRSMPEKMAFIEPASTVIGLKDKLSLSLDLGGADVKKAKLKWTTSDKKVATVSGKGVVTGKSAGFTTITATAKNGLSASIEIEVKDIHAPYKVIIEPAEVAPIPVNGTVQLKATPIAESTVKTKLKWSTDNKKVATVSSKGLVTGKATGTAKITVTTTNKVSASVTITVQ